MAMGDRDELVISPVFWYQSDNFYNKKINMWTLSMLFFYMINKKNKKIKLKIKIFN
jgi:hypothetical protein